MKLSKKHKYTVLCEDKLTHCFIRRFLLAQGINGRKIFPLPLPADGCGEQYVRMQFPKQLRALRSKSFDSNVLIVAIDADKKTVQERKLQFNDACNAVEIEARTEDDKLLIFIPKRNIETWIKYFDGDIVDEEHDYAHYLNGHESDCYSAADKMAESFSTENFTSELSALQDAYNEYCGLVSQLNA